MKKFFSKLLLSTICITSISTTAFANSIVPNEVNQQEIENQRIVPRAHNMEYKSICIETKQKEFDCGAVANQPRDGITFPSSGG